MLSGGVASAQGYDDGGVVRGLLLGTRPFVDLASLQAGSQRRGEQKVIDANAAIMFEGLPEVVPEGEEAALVRVQRTEGVGIAQFEQVAIVCPGLGLKERILDP